MAQPTKLFTSIPDSLLHFVITNPEKNKYGSRTSYFRLSKENPERPRFQMAASSDRLEAPYGISDPYDEKNKETDRKSLDISITNDSLTNILNEVDEFILSYAAENCEKWFNKKFSIEQLRFMYRPLVTQPKPGKNYPPTFRTKVNLDKKTKNHTRFFTVEEQDNKVSYTVKDEDVLPKGKKTKVIPIIEFASIWFNTAQFGVTLETTDVIAYCSDERVEFPFNLGEDVVVEAFEEGSDKGNKSGGGPMQQSDSNDENKVGVKPDEPNPQSNPQHAYEPPSSPHHT